MKATDAYLLSFIFKAPQFIIPIYQRTYSWTEKECRQLWKTCDAQAVMLITCRSPCCCDAAVRPVRPDIRRNRKIY